MRGEVIQHTLLSGMLIASVFWWPECRWHLKANSLASLKLFSSMSCINYIVLDIKGTLELRGL